MRRAALLILVAAACVGGDRDPERTLGQLRQAVLEQARHIPNYTCVQTIDRTFFRPVGAKPGHPGPCDEIAALKLKKAYHLVATIADRFRVDVRAGGGGEMYSWVGATGFGDRPLHELLGAGPSSTGAFGPILIDLVQDAPEFKFEGEKAVNRRTAYAYSFHVPVERSHHSFLLLGGSEAPIAYEGTVLADPDTGAPLHLSILSNDLPPETNCCQVAASLEYSRVRIGASEFLLPSKASQRFVTPGGQEAEFEVAFSSCREYRAEAALAFGDAPPEAPARPESATAPALEAPEGLPVSIALTGRIDSATAAAGDPFTGRLAKPVLDARQHVLAPEGAVVHGRVARFTRAMNPDRATVRLSVDTVEIGGREIPFHVTGRPRTAPPMASRGGLQSRGMPIGELPQWTPANYAEVSCVGRRCAIRDGTRTDWVTAGQP